MKLQLHAEPWDVTRRLAELGLEEEALRAAVARGHLGWANCTPNHPRIYPPLVAWAETVGALRAYLATLGWENSDANNYALSVDADRRLAVGVATGNENTGKVHSTPMTTASKGKNTVSAILVNQGVLFPEFAVMEEEPASDRTTWLLLIHRDDNEIRCELSLPVSVGTDFRVDSWKERIILGAIPRDPQLRDISPPPQGPDLDIQIKRRA